jgi:hypothetical protein
MLNSKKSAYAKLQKQKETAYRAIFNKAGGELNEMSKIVLADLRLYCNATKTSFSSDIAEMARAEGKREVFNRIMSFLKVDYEEYFNLNEEFDNE